MYSFATFYIHMQCLLPSPETSHKILMTLKHNLNDLPLPAQNAGLEEFFLYIFISIINHSVKCTNPKSKLIPMTHASCNFQGYFQTF